MTTATTIRTTTVTTSLINSSRAELLRLRRWPAVWVTLGVWVLLALMFGYLFNYFSYKTGDLSFSNEGASTETIFADLLPAAVPDVLQQGRFKRGVIEEPSSSPGVDDAGVGLARVDRTGLVGDHRAGWQEAGHLLLGGSAVDAVQVGVDVPDHADLTSPSPGTPAGGPCPPARSSSPVPRASATPRPTAGLPPATAGRCRPRRPGAR